MITEEIRERLDLWNEANQNYYSINVDGADEEPLMSDEQFEQLTNDLLAYDEPEVTDTVTNKIWTTWGMAAAGEVKSQMVSLFKLKYESRANVVEIFKFLERRENLFMGPKLDGMAIKVFLEQPVNGYYPVRMIITRGGQDVTDILMFHRDFQLSAEKWDIPTLMVAGELVLPKKVFMERWSDESDNPKPYANPRNGVPGVLKREPNDLRFIPCTDGISPLVPKAGQSIWKAVTDQSQVYDIESFHQVCKSPEFDFQTDGVVIGYKTDRQTIKQNFVMNMVAVKFKAPKAKTIVTEITYTQKKSGALTPVVWFEPTPLDGSMVTKASGYNYNNLKVNHIGVGSHIIITKGGDIIPIVEKVITRSDKVPLPEVDYIVRGKHLYAVDMATSIRYKFVLGLKLLQVDGIGETTAEQIGMLVKHDIIRLFDPSLKPDIQALLGGGKLWEKFLVFYQTKTIGLDLLINLLQFDGCGPVLSKTFANVILGNSPSVAGVDKAVLNTVCRGEGFKKIKEAMTELQGYGVKVIKPVEINDESLTFEMSGNPPKGMTKADFEKALLLTHPNAVHTTLTKNTKYLFVDDLSSGSSKLNKGRAYNTKIVTYKTALAGKL